MMLTSSLVACRTRANYLPPKNAREYAFFWECILRTLTLTSSFSCRARANYLPTLNAIKYVFPWECVLCKITPASSFVLAGCVQSFLLSTLAVEAYSVASPKRHKAHTLPGMHAVKVDACFFLGRIIFQLKRHKVEPSRERTLMLTSSFLLPCANYLSPQVP